MLNSLANFIFGPTTDTIQQGTDRSEQIAADNNTSTSSASQATSIGRTDNNPNDRVPNLINNNDDVFNVEELDEDWLLVNKEEDENESLPATDSEEELPFVEIKHSPTFQQRPTPESNQHSVSAYHQRTIALRYDGGGLTQSLYVVPTTSGPNNENGTANFPAHCPMEESWFLTPPPCFTSTGPVNMETSPFENLLIEHPSMSVYHSIRSAQESAESFIDLDVGIDEPQQETIAVIKKSPRKEKLAKKNRSAASRVHSKPVHHSNRSAQDLDLVVDGPQIETKAVVQKPTKKEKLDKKNRSGAHRVHAKPLHLINRLAQEPKDLVMDEPQQEIMTIVQKTPKKNRSAAPRVHIKPMYHAIKLAQEPSDVFINVDLWMDTPQHETMAVVEKPTRNEKLAKKHETKAIVEKQPRREKLVKKNRSDIHRVQRNYFEQIDAEQCKAEYLIRDAQKANEKHEQQILSRTAIKRSNKSREYNSKSNCQRRSDMQHSMVRSFANNNRKC